MTTRKEFTVDSLQVNIYDTRKDMGESAAKMVADKICKLQETKKNLRMIFAAAPSQNEMLEALIKDTRIQWENIIAFHMDEYIGLPSDAPQAFSNFLKDKLFDRVNFKEVHLIQSHNDANNEIQRYSKLLQENPIDIVCLGVGENGHIAFNDPPVADFNDPSMVKSVELEEACRIQQVNDGCFKELKDVPTEALTLTIPALMQGEFLFCVVPGLTKTHAITTMLKDDISLSCPAGILRTHKNCILFLDKDSAAGVL